MASIAVCICKDDHYCRSLQCLGCGCKWHEKLSPDERKAYCPIHRSQAKRCNCQKHHRLNFCPKCPQEDTLMKFNQKWARCDGCDSHSIFVRYDQCICKNEDARRRVKCVNRQCKNERFELMMDEERVQNCLIHTDPSLPAECAFEKRCVCDACQHLPRPVIRPLIADGVKDCSNLVHTDCYFVARKTPTLFYC